MVQKSENLLKKKNFKITKWAHAFKGFAISYNFETLDTDKTLNMQLMIN